MTPLLRAEYSRLMTSTFPCWHTLQRFKSKASQPWLTTMVDGKSISSCSNFEKACVTRCNQQHWPCRMHNVKVSCAHRYQTHGLEACPCTSRYLLLIRDRLLWFLLFILLLLLIYLLRPEEVHIVDHITPHLCIMQKTVNVPGITASLHEPTGSSVHILYMLNIRTMTCTLASVMSIIKSQAQKESHTCMPLTPKQTSAEGMSDHVNYSSSAETLLAALAVELHEYI